MARSTLLTAAAAFGLWTQSDGTEKRAPCPPAAAFSAEPLRLPAQCTAHAAGVCQSPAGWTAEQAHREELSAKITGLERELSAMRERAERAEELAEQTQERLIQDLDTLKIICKPAPPPTCPTWTARLEGAVLSAAACSAYIIGAQK